MTIDNFMRTNRFLKLYPPESNSWVGKVTFSFSYPDHGWIQLAVTCTAYVQGVIVATSNVFDPFPGLVRWLGDIAAGRISSECIIEEEGYAKIFRATPVNEDEFVFQILEWLFNKGRQVEQPIYLYVQVNRNQFLSEFLKRWDDFIQNQYDPAHWEEHGATNLRELDMSKIREFMKE
jgi:hypothetical protein